MGFSAVWNASFHHDLLGAVEGTNPEKNMDRLMESILSHKGVSGWDRAVVFSHNHDEVGNTGSWIGRAAARSRDDKDVLKPYPRAVARSAAAVTLTAAGVPMIFQGEEFLANNDFKHGITSTWGADLRWLDFDVNPARLDEFNRISALPASKKEKEVEKLPEKLKGLFARYERMTPEEKAQAEVLSDRAGIFESYRDLVALRGKSEAFIADAPIQRIFTHNADRVMAFERKGGGDDFVVITNFADVERPGYKVTLPPGKWKEVFNTNARSYGGSGTGNGGSTMAHDQGVYLPAGSTIILKRV
jgi:1,4-alpha-glucan branching enzyme